MLRSTKSLKRSCVTQQRKEVLINYSYNRDNSMTKAGQWRRYSYEALIGARAPSSFGNCMHSAAVASLTVKLRKLPEKICIRPRAYIFVRLARSALKLTGGVVEESSYCALLTRF